MDMNSQFMEEYKWSINILTIFSLTTHQGHKILKILDKYLMPIKLETYKNLKIPSPGEDAS